MSEVSKAHKVCIMSDLSGMCGVSGVCEVCKVSEVMKWCKITYNLLPVFQYLRNRCTPCYYKFVNIRFKNIDLFPLQRVSKLKLTSKLTFEHHH